MRLDDRRVTAYTMGTIVVPEKAMIGKSRWSLRGLQRVCDKVKVQASPATERHP